MHHRHDTLHCFRAELRDPAIRLNRGELARRAGSRRALPPNLAGTSAQSCSTPVRRPGAGSCRPSPGDHSHSIVPGGLLVMSSTTRPTGRISLIIREAICSSRSYGRRAQSAVIASSLVTARITITLP